MNRPAWLPPLVELDHFGGDWHRYLDALYSFFLADFVKNRPKFRDALIGLKRHPVIAGKEATFWHLISSGKAEEERLPDMRRCERIRWPRPVIENESDLSIKVWENRRGGERRICLWLESEDYLVVLADRKGYVILWTAYLVTQPHQKRKLQAEYEECSKS